MNDEQQKDTEKGCKEENTPEEERHVGGIKDLRKVDRVIGLQYSKEETADHGRKYDEIAVHKEFLFQELAVFEIDDA